MVDLSSSYAGDGEGVGTTLHVTYLTIMEGMSNFFYWSPIYYVVPGPVEPWEVARLINRRGNPCPRFDMAFCK